MNKENIIRSANYDLVAKYLSIDSLSVKNYFNKFRPTGKKNIDNPTHLREFIEKYEYKGPGIYCIENTKTGRKYIGKSIDMYTRKCAHFVHLKGNKHACKPLQEDYNIFGEKYFQFSIIESCDQSSLEEKEKNYILKYSPELLYNIQSNIRWDFSDDEIIFIKKMPRK